MNSIKRKFINYKKSDKLIHIAETHINKDQSIDPHYHDHLEFFIVTEGVVTHSINGIKNSIRSNSLQFVFPENVHAIYNNAYSESATWINFAFPIDLLNNDLLAMFNHVFPNTENRLVNSVPVPLTLMESIRFKVKLLTSDIGLLDQKIIFNGLFLDILTIYLKASINQYKSAPYWLTRALEQFKRKQNYLEGLPKLIELSGKTQEHLNREMKRYYNMTPTQYIKSIRLIKAEKILLKTNLSIVEICHTVGFNNLSHFNKSFKENYGITPSEFRNHHYI